MNGRHRNILPFIIVCLGLFLGIRYLLPLVMPFLLGAALALAAEPMTGLLSRKMPRWLAAALAMTAAWCFLMLVLVLLGALVVKEMGQLARVIPDLEETARSGMTALSGWLHNLARLAPDSLEHYLVQNIDEFFSDGTAFLDKIAGYLLNFASGILSAVPSGALGITTALISSYMICGKLPKIREYVQKLLGTGPATKAVAAWKKIKSTVGAWLVAQLKLSGITFLIVTMGFVILQVPYAPVWAAVVAVVDALPVLGTGTVLIPWALLCFLQHSQARGIGLLGIYAVVLLTRSVMEPRLVGQQLGLDPLVTLIAFYAGYKIWGIAGMILAPMLTAAIFQITRSQA